MNNRDNVNNIIVFQVKVDQCVRDLTFLKSNTGHYEAELEGALVGNMFRGVHKVSGCPAEHVAQAKMKFINKLIEHIEER